MRCVLILFILFNIGCNTNNYINKECPILSHTKYADHSCPEAGHGVCYVCYDPNLNQFNKQENISKNNLTNIK